MAKYLCQTSNVKTPPSYVHSNFDSAETEAKRLCQLHQCSVAILQVVATVKYENAPVMAMQPVIHKENLDELPF
jgi:hypothetical protein